MKKNKIAVKSLAANKGEDGLVGNPNGPGVHSAGYRKLQETIRARATAHTPEPLGSK